MCVDGWVVVVISVVVAMGVVVVVLSRTVSIKCSHSHWFVFFLDSVLPQSVAGTEYTRPRSARALLTPVFPALFTRCSQLVSFDLN